MREASCTSGPWSGHIDTGLRPRSDSLGWGNQVAKAHPFITWANSDSTGHKRWQGVPSAASNWNIGSQKCECHEKLKARRLTIHRARRA